MLAASTKGNACAGFDSRPARVSEEPLSRHCAAAVIALGGQCSGVGASKRSGRAHARPGKFAALSRIPSSPPVRGWVGGVGRGKGGWRKREDLFFRFGRLGARPDGLTAHLQPPPSASRVLLIRPAGRGSSSSSDLIGGKAARRRRHPGRSGRQQTTRRGAATPALPTQSSTAFEASTFRTSSSTTSRSGAAISGQMQQLIFLRFRLRLRRGLRRGDGTTDRRGAKRALNDS